MRSSALALACLVVAACDDGPRSVSIRFAPMFGERAFSCAAPVEGLGTGAGTVQVRDFRMYVSGVMLLTPGGERVPLTLTDDGRWQRDGIALLDFEDDSGTCNTGSPDTNLELRGTAPAGDYTGVVFTLGLPEEHNHLDAATAPAPLNAQGMWWSWSGGYKYLKIDLTPATQPDYYFHLGATACDGTVADGFTCQYGNRAEIELADFDPDAAEIVVDAAAIFAAVDVDRKPDGMTDTLPGCMAFPGDPECTPMLAPLGLTYLGDEPAAAQRVFSVRAR
jgi:uncharacterized repeat protein (TIGR04052 family)